KKVMGIVDVSRLNPIKFHQRRVVFLVIAIPPVRTGRYYIGLTTIFRIFSPPFSGIRNLLIRPGEIIYNRRAFRIQDSTGIRRRSYISEGPFKTVVVLPKDGK